LKRGFALSLSNLTHVCWGVSQKKAISASSEAETATGASITAEKVKIIEPSPVV